MAIITLMHVLNHATASLTSITSIKLQFAKDSFLYIDFQSAAPKFHLSAVTEIGGDTTILILVHVHIWSEILGKIIVS